MTVHVLGPVEITKHGAPVPVRRRKQRLLIALLATRANQLVPLSRIIDVLWEQEVPKAARNQVHVHVAAVRRALTASDGDPAAVETCPTGYVLHAPPADVDLVRFDNAVSRGESELSAGRLTEADRLFRTALAAWRGTPLDGLEGRFAHAESARLEQRRLRVHEHQLDIGLTLGRFADLVPELAGLLTTNPLHEGFRRRYMLALYGAGRSADALAAFRDGRRVLGDELGIEPTRELRDTEVAILRATPVEELVGELLPPARRGERPDWGPRPRPQQLPAQANHFVGRTQVLARLDDVAGRRRSPVLVTGPGGIGKTAVCTRWAHANAAEFPDGALYIDLRGSGPTPVEPADALGRFLRALGTPADRIPGDVNEAAADFRSLLASTRTLILLDDAASAAQVRPLLPGTPSCRAVVTSRHRLDELTVRDGVEPIRLDALSATEAGDLLAAIAGRRRLHNEPTGTIARLAAACEYRPTALRGVALQLAERPELRIAGYLRELLAAPSFP
ncbi:AfsR/SARP family transcriptional regulator [Amycolatopsis solani]|uniref:AfsR/SARP family transcriptional regulator n=1 Tax=Amycolatopsis solani TaxID=3028615 RepID=UPI00296F8F42|nr:BTAD domain-containing putative transcriptional regulator [Amycolatopsis sp. MEP2-6]